MTKTRGFSKGALQLMAVVAMITDHSAVFVPWPWLYYTMKAIGRITIIIMAYFVAEGYYKTKSLGKYITRMGLFAGIAQIPYYFYHVMGNVPKDMSAIVYGMFSARNVIFTLFIGLCLLTIVKSDYKIWVKVIATAAALFIVRKSDWGYYGVLWVVATGLFHGNKNRQFGAIAVIQGVRMLNLLIAILRYVLSTKLLPYSMIYGWVVQLAGFLAIPLLAKYNGEKGNMPKWTFYIVYPVQFVIVVALWYFINR